MLPEVLPILSPAALSSSQGAHTTGVQVQDLGADRRPALVYLARLAPSSRRTMRRALATISGLLTGGADEDGRPWADVETFPWWALRYEHTSAVRREVAERYAPATANRYLSALRGVLQETWRLGLMSAESHQRAADLKNVSGSTLPAGREIGLGELRSLFAACAEDPTPAGVRDAALFGVLYTALLRRAEAVALDLAHYQAEDGKLEVRQGKGRKDRLTYVADPGAQEALEAWLELRGPGAGPLFCPISQTGEITVRRLTDQALYNILRKRQAQAGVQPLSPHDFRRTGITHLLEAGADISAVQQLAGHASVNTTTRYDRRGERAKRKAASLLHVPYVRRRRAAAG